MSTKAKELARELRQAATKLDNCSTVVNINRVVTNSASFLGSALIITGGALAPFTGGASVAGAVAIGAACSTAGTIQNLAGSAIGATFSKCVLKAMDKKLKEFRKTYSLSAAEPGVGQIAGSLKDVCRTAKSMKDLGKLTRGVLLGSVLNAGLSMYDIIDASIDLSKNTGCPAGQLLRTIADLLDDLD